MTTVSEFLCNYSFQFTSFAKAIRKTNCLFHFCVLISTKFLPIYKMNLRKV